MFVYFFFLRFFLQQHVTSQRTRGCLPSGSGPITWRHVSASPPPHAHLLLSHPLAKTKREGRRRESTHASAAVGPTCHPPTHPPNLHPKFSNREARRGEAKLVVVRIRENIATTTRGGGGERGGDVRYPGGRRRRRERGRLVPRLRHPRGPPGGRVRGLPVGRIPVLLQPEVI